MSQTLGRILAGLTSASRLLSLHETSGHGEQDMKPLTHAHTDARPRSKSDGSRSQQGTMPGGGGGGGTDEREGVAFSAPASSTATPTSTSTTTSTSCSAPDDLVHRVQVQGHEIEHFLRAGLGMVQG